VSIRSNTLKAFIVGMIIPFVFAAPVFAVSDNAGGTNNQAQSGGNSNSASGSADNQNQDSNGNSTNSGEQSSNGKLSDTNKRICEQSSNRIQKLFSNMNQLANNQINLLSQIEQKVRTFYENNNLSIDNYDELVQEAQNSRVAAQTVLQTITQTSSQFGCDGDDPKSIANEYKVQVRTQVKEIKNYQIAVKNLTIAVKSAAEEE
jgi:hypothetical protein